MTTAVKSVMSLVDLRMQEWGLQSAPRTLRESVRTVLRELKSEPLMLLGDKRLEGHLVDGSNHSDVWAYFPIRPRWIRSAHEMVRAGIHPFKPTQEMALELKLARAFGNLRNQRLADLTERLHIVHELLPRPATRVLLVFGTPEKHEQFREYLRDHLGHVLLFLRNPRLNNECSDAMKEWRRSRVPRRNNLAQVE